MTNYKWPLNVNNFNLWDRFKICLFFLNPFNRWTMDKYVKKFEQEMAKFVGCKYAIFTSSGSTANTILAMYLKDIKRDNYSRNVIIFPSTTWTTSITPFLREGFEPKFIDINLNDLSIDLNKLEKYLKLNHKKVSCIFITSLLGFVPNVNKILDIQKKYKVQIYMDNCECNFGNYDNKNISSYFTSTTSTYFGHQLQSVEGGFIFTNDEYEYNMFLLYRNHGMVRSLKENNKVFFTNKNVDPRFDFYLKGNNFRNTDINAFIGLIDFNKKKKYIENRNLLYIYFIHYLWLKKADDKYVTPISNFNLLKTVPFSIPIILKNDNNKKQIIEEWCEKNGIETRPIISGNLLRQTCFKQYDKFNKFPNSEYLHKYGLYIGLHNKLRKKDILKLTSFLSNI